MDWKSVTFDWNRARAFLVTAEEGSLSAAARALGMTQPTLGRQVTALEEELGVLLFDRVGRGLVLTHAGAQLMEHVRAMGDAAASLSLVASGQAQAVEGTVAVTASEIYSMWLLPTALKTLSERAPGIHVEVVASNAVRDLKRREADIAIRNARPDQPDLIGKLVAHDRGGFFATADCLRILPPIETPEDLAKARLVGMEENARYIAALNERGIPVTEQNFSVTPTTHPVHWEMTRAGLGIGVGPLGFAARHPGLVRVLPDVEFEYPVWLVAHRELRTSPRVRLVWDTLAETVPELLKA
ncbi:LysR family transcriptional regulator [Pacificoceanicola onchidii]|uniref:LysR family transcriptional regulator n=1 Tax=Pacificoceanicola onchidii TaxID=2562685 RepID=UPI0010A3734F|nr:LysR family transcriptional regulator [Pacificoceanicola onchidii]